MPSRTTCAGVWPEGGTMSLTKKPSEEIYRSFRAVSPAGYEINQFLKICVDKDPLGKMDSIKYVELDPLDSWTNKETYSDYLRWAADEIDDVPMQRPEPAYAGMSPKQIKQRKKEDAEAWRKACAMMPGKKEKTITEMYEAKREAAAAVQRAEDVIQSVSAAPRKVCPRCGGLKMGQSPWSLTETVQCAACGWWGNVDELVTEKKKGEETYSDLVNNF